jgi:hypothetical protein
VERQFKSPDLEQVADHFTIPLPTLEAIIQGFKELFPKVMASLSQLAGRGRSEQGSQAGPNWAQSQQQQPPIPPPAGRSTLKAPAGRGDRAPAAPTTDKPPFSFATGPSPPPLRVPHYAESPAPTLTPDKLTLPPSKKRRPNNEAGASAAPTQAPNEAGTATPPKASAPPQIPQTQLPLQCTVPGCGSEGFENAEALAKHFGAVHEPKPDNPLVWVLECIRAGLGLDADGKPKPREAAPNMEKAASAQSMKLSASAQGFSPAMKAEGSIPMSRGRTSQLSNTALPKTPQQQAATVKTPLTDSKVALAKPGPAKLDPADAKEPLTPPDDGWTDLGFSPDDISARFPTLADLQGCPSLESLTPTSTIESGSKSEKATPKSSDIAEMDDLRISTESETDWIPKEFFADADFVTPEDLLGGEEIYDMDWEVIPPEKTQTHAHGQAGKAGKGKDLEKEINFDPGLFWVEAP